MKVTCLIIWITSTLVMLAYGHTAAPRPCFTVRSHANRHVDLSDHNACASLTYFEGVVFEEQNACVSECKDDDVDAYVIPYMLERMRTWLRLNALCFEAPSALRDFMQDVADDESTSSSIGVTPDQRSVFNDTNWDAAMQYGRLLRQSRSIIPLAFSSLAAFEKGKRRIMAAYTTLLQGEGSNITEAALAMSPLAAVVKSFFADGIPTEKMHWPHPWAFPTFVSLQHDLTTNHDTRLASSCSSCPASVAAFHRLLDTVDMMCRSDHRSVTSCPPVLFLVTHPADGVFAVVPQLTVVQFPAAQPLVSGTRSSNGSESSGGFIGRGRRRQSRRVGDIMMPFSFRLDHASILFDYLSFLIHDEVIQLRYLSSREAEKIRAHLRAISAKRDQLQLLQQRKRDDKALMGDTNITGDVEEGEEGKDDENEGVQKELDHLRESEEQTGKVRSVKDMMALVIRSMEAAEGENTTAKQLVAFAKAYAFTSHQPSAPIYVPFDNSTWLPDMMKIVVASIMRISMVNLLSGVWVVLFVWTLGSHLFRRR